MEIIKIGNWTITEEGISWSGKGNIKYFIDKDRITEQGDGENSNIYDWLVHIVEKPWLTKEDIYALNMYCSPFVKLKLSWNFEY